MMGGTVAGEEVASSEVQIPPSYNIQLFFLEDCIRSQSLLDEFLQLADARGLLLGGGGTEGQGGAAIAS